MERRGERGGGRRGIGEGGEERRWRGGEREKEKWGKMEVEKRREQRLRECVCTTLSEILTCDLMSSSSISITGEMTTCSIIRWSIPFSNRTGQNLHVHTFDGRLSLNNSGNYMLIEAQTCHRSKTAATCACTQCHVIYVHSLSSVAESSMYTLATKERPIVHIHLCMDMLQNE